MVYKTDDSVKKFKPLSAQQRHVIRAIKNSEITLITGPAGCGKSLLSAWAGIQLLKDKESEIEKIYIVRLAVETCGENIGSLPGMLTDKTFHLLGPIYDNLLLFMNEGDINYLVEKKKIEVIPISHLRGRSLNNCFIIAEEIQNLNFHMVLTLLTRLGKNSKMVLNGDPNQPDVPGACGVIVAKNLLQDVQGVAVAEMSIQDVKRNPIIIEILKRAQEYYNLPMPLVNESKVTYSRSSRQYEDFESDSA
jgi:phosphate starvation-inducible protein PhoH and related proteins